MVPIFLAKHKEKVLHSGKYLNVIRECGKDLFYPYPHHENIFLGGSRFNTKFKEGEDEEMKEEGQQQ